MPVCPQCHAAPRRMSRIAGRHIRPSRTLPRYSHVWLTLQLAKNPLATRILPLPGLPLPKGYQEYSFPRLFVPWNIHSHDGTFVLGTICSLEHSFPGPFVPWNIRSLELSFQVPGPFLPRTVRSFVSRAVPGLEQRNKQKRRPTTATVHSRYTQTVDRRYSASRLNRFSSSERG